MKIYTMGFTQKTAEEFFTKIKKSNIDILIDIRLNNQSQLAGFTKGKDLKYLLKEIANCDYSHEISFAPTKELLDDYKKKKVDWNKYVEVFEELIKSRNMVEKFESKYGKYERVLLLCSEPTPEQCHRRLVAEAISKKIGYEICHL